MFSMNVIGLVLFLHFLKDLGTYGCMDTWISFQGSCYSFNINKTNWFHAARACADMDSFLVSVWSESEENFLKDTIRKYHSTEDPDTIGYWTGGNDLEVEGHWVWGYPDGEPMKYTNWFPGEPNNMWYDQRAEDCVALWGHDAHQFSWNDEPCDNAEYYICKSEGPVGVVG